MTWYGGTGVRRCLVIAITKWLNETFPYVRTPGFLKWLIF